MYKLNNYWFSFVDELKYNNRYFPKHPLLNDLKKYVKANIKIVEKDTKLYRARIVNDIKDTPTIKFIDANGGRVILNYYQHLENFNFNQLREGQFLGYNKENSFVPLLSCIPGGRANPKFIPVLYASEQLETAIIEVKPLFEQYVSVAEINVDKRIKIVDFARDRYMPDIIDENYSIKDAINEISKLFSMPTNNQDDYLVTQFISEFIKNLNVDGFRFESSLYKNGINMVIYNYQKCRAIKSDVFVLHGCNYDIGHYCYREEYGR
ncbi:RES family NAD+ phosphorylase [Papillibacter cinnamivorans]|uniref:RES domain-containing protein n=1 Tax=Papillibacter cinnamivorans DSM 12816 TaxID=1122930 RepID=A0A1W1ZG30_9FIRM|nr:RES family NAD+ phosphorylase [Papillibacter cinnamivorans]SMC47323.1 RES domain-containing protein [Papillibacter cinnamivorans DSM 12816]